YLLGGVAAGLAIAGATRGTRLLGFAVSPETESRLHRFGGGFALVLVFLAGATHRLGFPSFFLLTGGCVALALLAAVIVSKSCSRRLSSIAGPWPIALLLLGPPALDGALSLSRPITIFLVMLSALAIPGILLMCRTAGMQLPAVARTSGFHLASTGGMAI